MSRSCGNAFFEFTFLGDGAKVSVALSEIETFGQLMSKKSNPSTLLCEEEGTLIRLKSGKELLVREKYQNVRDGLLRFLGLDHE